MKLQWGLLSTARINRRLIPAIRAAKRAELLAVASRDQARADAYAAEWDIPRAHGSYQALLDDPDIDAVYISLPNSLHAEWTARAAQAGKHVLCEKPLALSVAQCDQIMAAAEAAGVVAAEAVMYLYHPLLHKTRELVQDGAVGQVKLVRGSFSFFLDRPADVRWEPELGGGSLWDVGSYPVSFIRWIAGEPEQVFGWQASSDSGVDETFAGLLRYESGVLGLLDSSFRQPFRVQAEVIGTTGSLSVERPFPINSESRIILRRDEKEKKIRVSKADPYRCQVDALTAAVLDGAALPVPLSSSRANVATLVALYESAHKGVPVTITGA
ncbi:MAG: Gfo/Idh/MocA family oxidoreductase [Anaerolineae bacterium]|jgi:predicted dehydrogenase